jgi:hypothetical protein
MLRTAYMVMAVLATLTKLTLKVNMFSLIFGSVMLVTPFLLFANLIYSFS